MIEVADEGVNIEHLVVLTDARSSDPIVQIKNEPLNYKFDFNNNLILGTYRMDTLLRINNVLSFFDKLKFCFNFLIGRYE